MLAQLCWKSFKLGFSSTWTENFKWQAGFQRGRGTRHQTANTLLVFWEICMQVKKQQLELDMEQWTGSKLGKEFVKAVYCHCAYLTYMQSTSCKMPGWMKHKLESRLTGEILIISDMQMSVQSLSRIPLLPHHEPQHARPPCPSPTPRVHPNPCPWSQWCHPTISSSVFPFSSCPQSFPA